MKAKNILLAIALLVGTTMLPVNNLDAHAANQITFNSPAMDVAKDMKVGWNLGNGLDAYDSQGGNETAWGNPTITPSLIQKVKDAGFKTIRIPVTYMNRIGPAPDYTVDSAWLNRVQQVVDYVQNKGLYAIIDIHADANHDYIHGAWLHIDDPDQTIVRTKFKKVWEQIANKFKDYDQKLIFESMNEQRENGNYGEPKRPSTYDNINALNQICVDTVRATGSNNAKRFIIVPGYNTNIYYTAVYKGFKLPTDSAKDKLMVSAHYYDPYQFTLDEQADNIYAWGQSAVNAGNPHAVSADENSVQESMQQIKYAFISKGIPVIIGEFGAEDKSFINSSNKEYRRYFYEYVTKAICDAGALPICWDSGWTGKYGIALFNRNTNMPVHQELIDAIMRGSSGRDYAIAQPAV